MCVFDDSGMLIFSLFYPWFTNESQGTYRIEQKNKMRKFVFFASIDFMGFSCWPGFYWKSLPWLSFLSPINYCSFFVGNLSLTNLVHYSKFLSSLFARVKSNQDDLRYQMNGNHSRPCYRKMSVYLQVLSYFDVDDWWDKEPNHELCIFTLCLYNLVQNKNWLVLTCKLNVHPHLFQFYNVIYCIRLL